MNIKTKQTAKKLLVKHADDSKKYWMAAGEYVGVVVGKEQTNAEYVISDGIIEVGSAIPDHYHKWEDQTFHILEGQLEAKIGDQLFELSAGDTVHCPRGVSHYMKNTGTQTAKLISYIFPGDWAEDFMAATSEQVKSGQIDLKRIEEEFGVVYI